MDKIRTMVSLIALACFPLLAFGVVIQQEHGEFGSKQKQKTTLYAENGKIRMESDDQRGGKTIMIFDGDKQVMWMIQPAEGTYTEMTAADVANMSQMASQASQRMEEAMKNMTPEQRAMMESAMKGRGGAMGGAPPPPPTITFQAKGGSDKFGSFTCSKYDELSNGKRTAEICAASLEQVHLKPADVKSFEAMAKFFEPMRRMSPRGGYSAPRIEQLHGFPVHSVSYDGDKPTYETTVLSVDQKSVDASMFTLPAGLKKMDMMGGRQPR